MSSSIRIKVQVGTENEEQVYQNYSSVLKFIFVVESPSHKTIDELVRILQKHINENFLNHPIELVQLTTVDGFLLSKWNKCSDVLKDNDHILCIDMQTFSRKINSTIDWDNLWLKVLQHDASDNLEKSIQIGLDSFSKLFISFFAGEDAFRIYVFSVMELMTIASEKRRGKEDYIGRLGSSDSNADWFLEAKWDFDANSNKDLFVICNVKVASEDGVYSEKLHVRLDQSRMRIEKGEVTRLSGEKSDGVSLSDRQLQRWKELTSKLPPPKRTGPQINLNLNETPKLSKYECEGESSIRMAYGNTNVVNTFQNTHSNDDGTFRQHFVITHIIFSKKSLVLPEILQQKRAAPADKPISVASLTVFYQSQDGAWRACEDVAIAPVTVRNEEAKWLTDSIINIEPDKLVSYAIRGWILTKGDPGRDNQARSRVHKSFPQPLKLKIVVTDNFNRQCSLIVEQLNKPLELITREAFLKNNRSSINELLAFVYADDCENDGRIYSAMYLDKSQNLVIKIPGSVSGIYGRTALRTMEYNARQNKSSEVPLDHLQYNCDDDQGKTIALYDPETFILYAVRLELATKTSKTEETIAVPIEKIQP